jgi:hypothetical protein
MKMLIMVAMISLFSGNSFADVSAITFYKHAMVDGSQIVPNCLFAISITSVGKLYLSPIADCGGGISTEITHLNDGIHPAGSLETLDHRFTYVPDGDNYNIVQNDKVVAKLIRTQN